MASYIERRKQVRKPVPMRVEVRLESGVLVEGNTVNVSLNGLLFETERSLPLGTRVRVYLTPESPSHEHIMCKGEVSRLDDWGVAIAFDQIQPGQVETLYHYIRYTVSGAPVA